MALNAMRTEWQRIFQQVNTGSATLTAVSPTTGTTSAGSATIAVPGAAVGDIVDVSPPAAPAAGLVLYGYVTAAGIVTVYVSNVSAGTLASPAGLYKVATYPFTNEVS